MYIWFFTAFLPFHILISGTYNLNTHKALWASSQPTHIACQKFQSSILEGLWSFRIALFSRHRLTDGVTTRFLFILISVMSIPLGLWHILSQLPLSTPCKMQNGSSLDGTCCYCWSSNIELTLCPHWTGLCSDVALVGSCGANVLLHIA